MVAKFSKNPKKIIVLGDGKQTKSYLHVDDCVNAMITCYSNMNKQKTPAEIFNVANHDQITVDKIVKTIGNSLNVNNFKTKYNVSDSTGRGWMGDIPVAKLSITKLSSLNWKPTKSSVEAIRLVIQEIQ